MTLLDYFDLRVAFALYFIIYYFTGLHTIQHFFLSFYFKKEKNCSVSSYCKKSIFLLECLSAVIGQ